MPDRPPPASLALLEGLRSPHKEVQLTRAIAAVAQADRRFAAQLVRFLLEAVEPSPKSKRLLQGLPSRLYCFDEERVADEDGFSRGRVDLCFQDSEEEVPKYCLFVEVKLDSDFASGQREKYLQAADRLAQETTTGDVGLMTLTRVQPPNDAAMRRPGSAWLGGVRFLEVLRGLQRVHIRDPDLRRQWRLFLSLLERHGDLGYMTLNQQLMRCWSRAWEAEDRLETTFQGIAPRALGLLNERLAQRNARSKRGSLPAALAKEAGPFVKSTASVGLRFLIPRTATKWRLWFAIEVDDSGDLILSYVVRWPGGPAKLSTSREVDRALNRLGYGRNEGRTNLKYTLDRYIEDLGLFESRDVEESLLADFEAQIDGLVSAGIFDRGVQPTRG